MATPKPLTTSLMQEVMAQDYTGGFARRLSELPSLAPSQQEPTWILQRLIDRQRLRDLHCIADKAEELTRSK